MGEDWVRRKEEKREGRFRVPVIVKIAAGLLLLCILCIVGYVVYMQANYYRIEDYAELEVENGQKKTLKTGETYTAVTISGSAHMDRTIVSSWTRARWMTEPRQRENMERR